eukprot:Sspe_Gene.65058::Locus_38524_Transcript_1_1_Confidence_1.000_Length_2135::g.65058::m.65058
MSVGLPALKEVKRVVCVPGAYLELIEETLEFVEVLGLHLSYLVGSRLTSRSKGRGLDGFSHHNECLPTTGEREAPPPVRDERDGEANAVLEPLLHEGNVDVVHELGLRKGKDRKEGHPLADPDPEEPVVVLHNGDLLVLGPGSEHLRLPPHHDDGGTALGERVQYGLRGHFPPSGVLVEVAHHGDEVHDGGGEGGEAMQPGQAFGPFLGLVRPHHAGGHDAVRVEPNEVLLRGRSLLPRALPLCSQSFDLRRDEHPPPEVHPQVLPEPLPPPEPRPLTGPVPPLGSALEGQEVGPPDGSHHGHHGEELAVAHKV